MENTRIHTGADTRSSPQRGCTGLDNPDEPLRCVFSSVREVKVGTGTTARKQITKLLWYVEQHEADEFGVRKINPQFVPTGEEEIIDQETLLAEYTPEVEIHNTQVEPALRGLNKAVAKGDKHRKKNEPLSAEMEYTKALDVDETNVRAMFGLGLVYLSRQDKEKSRFVFDQLVALNAAFDLKHKHLFNEFGIALRKSKLYDEAVLYYSRAVELTDEDENLYFNLSRAFYEKNDWEQCFEFSNRALGLDAYHEQALAMCKHIATMSKNDTLRDRHGKPPVPDTVAREVSDLLGTDDDMDMAIELGPGGFGDSNSDNSATSFSLDDKSDS